MLRRVQTQAVALVVFFTFCQVSGAMCALPDLSEAKETAILVEESMACPMDGTTMCPPSVTSSPGRQVKNGAVIELDQGPTLLSLGVVLTAISAPAPWSRSSAGFIVPLSIGSSPVLRI